MGEKRRPPCKRELFKRTLTTQKRKTFCDRRRGKRKTLSSFNSDQTLKKALRPPPPSLFPDTFRRNSPHRRKYGRGERGKGGWEVFIGPAAVVFLEPARRDALQLRKDTSFCLPRKRNLQLLAVPPVNSSHFSSRHIREWNCFLGKKVILLLPRKIVLIWPNAK